MSEKRFIDGVEVEKYMLVFGEDGTRIVDNENEKELYAIDVVALLNQLSDENEQLKKGLYIEQADCKNIRESRDYWRNKAKAIEEDHKRQENEIKLLRAEYSKIPPKIREVWRE